MRKNLRELIRLMVESDGSSPSPEPAQVDPREFRKSKIEEAAAEIARKLRLVDVRFLSRSKRRQGAYTFSAIDERNENVVLKIQPESELAGYIKAQQMIVRIPRRTARHLPMIHKIRTFDELGMKPVVDQQGAPEKLGVIVMERLEEVPGNMFDMITEPATESVRSLVSLINDRRAFNEMIDEVIRKSRNAILSTIKKSDRRVKDEDEVERLRMMLRSTAFSPESLDIDPDFMINATDALSAVVWEKVELWCKNLGITKPGVVQTLAKTLIGSIEVLLGRRAVPKEPSREAPGALGRIKGIRELVKALDDLKSLKLKMSDVHGNNIMIRPETGELVLSDLGHFV